MRNKYKINVSVFKSVTREHASLVIGTVIGVVLIFVFALYPAFQSSGSENEKETLLLFGFFNALLAVSASVVAAGLVGIIQNYYQISENEKRNNLKRLIGHDDWERVAIVLPVIGFDYTEVIQEDAKKDLRFEYSKKDSALHVSKRFGYEDLDAARKISSVFTALRIQQPKLHYDDFATDVLFPNNKGIGEKKHSSLDNVTTFICVGLHSNEITMRINAMQNTLFEIIDEHDKRRLAICDTTKIPTDWRNAGPPMRAIPSDISDEDSIDNIHKRDDYGLVAKHILNVDGQDKTCIICGGGSARSTKIIGKWFRENYDTIPGLQTGDKEYRHYVGKKQFALGFKVGGTENEKDSIEPIREYKVAYDPDAGWVREKERAAVSKPQ